VLIGQHRLAKAIGFGNLPFCRLILSVTYPKRDWGEDLAMPEWLDRALIGVLVALAASFFWGCIAGVMGAFSILIWIAGIAAIVGIVSRGEEATNPSGGRTLSRPEWQRL
jgi:hypothetical protein